jgi:hypothetical protein
MTVDMQTAWDPGSGQVTTTTACDSSDSDSDNLDAHIDQLTLEVIAEGAEATVDRFTTNWPGLGNPPGPVRTARISGQTFRQFRDAHKTACQAALAGNPIDYS